MRSRGDSRALGDEGERAAARSLEQDGWTVLAAKLQVGRTEIDLVAERQGTVAFVEVKARRPGVSVTPGEAVDDRKIRRIARAAESWLNGRGLADTPWTLLLAAVELDDEGRAGAVTWQPLEED